MIDEAYKKAHDIGGKDGLNAISALDSDYSFIDDKELTLYGVPLLVKDNIDVKGFPTTSGSIALEDNIALRDAYVISNLRRNGAAIIGKTNLTEFANYVDPSMPAGYSSRGGQVINAVDRSLNPGGSSTGSAVAVAAGIVNMAVGTDTSHSVIACAKFNGICGLKPPVGVLSSDGIIPVAPTLDSAGALADSFANALKLYSGMRDEPLEEVKGIGLKNIKIAVNTANTDKMSSSEKVFLSNVIDRIREAGGYVSEVCQERAPLLKTIMRYEFRPALEKYLSSSSASLKTLDQIVAYYEGHPDTMMKYGCAYLKEALTAGGLGSSEYKEAMEVRRKTIGKVVARIEGYDAVLMTGPTNIMHFCGLPSVTVASSKVDESGIRRCLILYGTDEMRLYSAALSLETMIN